MDWGFARWSVLGLALVAACGGQAATSTGDAGREGGGTEDGPEGGPQPEGGPALKIAPLRSGTVDKVDLLFMIDNSASMGDKQELLRQAVPDLLTRLLTPNCIDDSNPGSLVVYGPCAPDAAGACTCAQGKLQFAPVYDMHIGIVSSSLGGRGSDACAEPEPNPVTQMGDTHNDDRGELINRADPMHNESETPVADASPSNFLAWFPPVAANAGKPNPPVTPITAAAQLITDFQDMVSGVHEYGCGYEAQMESWYRFLVQPDPYDHISRDSGECAGGAPSGTPSPYACLVGVDQTILQQRHDFLRPDSLVAVIVVTDENEETVDPLAVGTQGWAFLQDPGFPGSPQGTAARATSACGGAPVIGPNPGPEDPSCNSCAFAPNDPSCQMGGPFLSQADDEPNVRGFHQKQRFGVDPQFPITRYVNGLTSPSVPDRNGEHQNKGDYLGTNDCTNPLFATNLPTSPGGDLCHLSAGPRTPDLVYFAAITGVPHQLLQANPADPNSPQKPALTDADWTTILGKDPIHYDFTGVDPHMFESWSPRPGLMPPAGNTPGTDPMNGREWNTNQGDLEYACTFPLLTPRDCNSPQFTNACDCSPGRCGTCTGSGDTMCNCPPLCDPTIPTTQIRGKAYPAIRELSVARALGSQAVVSSLCPIHPTEVTPGDPLFGYRPAVAAIVDRLSGAFGPLCLPQVLPPDPSGGVACRILEVLPTPGSESACAGYPGMSAPDAPTLAAIRAQEMVDPSVPVCQLAELPMSAWGGASCAASSQAGWCYVTGAAAGPGCPQTILFSPGGNPPAGARLALVCP